jgi:hypothetical protein
MSIEAMKLALENELSASNFIDKAPQSWDKTERTEWARLQAMLHNIRVFKKAMRQAIAEAERQDKFCDNNCVWTDHHPDCVRSEQKPVVEVRLVAGGKPMFLMAAPPESFKDGDLLYTHPQPKREPVACVIDGKLMAYKNGPLPHDCLLYDQAL